jgi:hypothetical protein
MSDYYLYAVILKNCPYSIAGQELINSFNYIKKDFSIIETNEKEKYKTEYISTFPQIYLKRVNTNGTQLIGGYSDFKSIVDTFYHNTDNERIENKVNDFLKKNSSWNKKSFLRLIELIHNIKYKSI